MRKRLVCFKSRVQSTAEQNQDLGKHKCKAILLAFKKFRPQIYSIYFVIKTNICILVNQLNKSAADLLGALITYQLALLNIQQFKVQYIKGKKNVVADALLQQLELLEQTALTIPKNNVKDFINKQLEAITLSMALIEAQDLAYTCNAEVVSLKVLDTLTTLQF